MLSQAAARGLGQQVKSLLATDCHLRASNTVLEIEGSLTTGEFMEGWRQLKGWY
jgi:hypothetical protein